MRRNTSDRNPDSLDRSEFEGVEIAPFLLPSAPGRRLRIRWFVPALLLLGAGGIALALPGPNRGDRGRDQDPRHGVARSPKEGFDRAVDSLRTTIELYGARHADFERGRIDCATLTAGYDRVGRSVVDLGRRRRARRPLDPATLSAFESIMEDAVETDRRFDESGCARP